VAPALRALHAKGFKIVIFSNQNGIKGALEGNSAGTGTADTFRKRFDAFAAEVGVPLLAFGATQKDAKDPKFYRKPGQGGY